MIIYYVLLLLCGFSLCLVLDVAPRVLAVCVCVCVCGHVYVVYEDTNLYNDMGIT